MDSKSYIKDKSINMSRVLMGISRDEFVRDRDDILKLTNPKGLGKKWDLNIPNETRLRLFKLRTSFREPNC